MGSDHTQHNRHRWWCSWSGFIIVASLVGTLSSMVFTVRSAIGGRGRGDTLVVYIFSNSNAQSMPNLKYFVREGILQEDGTDYLILLQDRTPDAELPQLPSNAHYVRHVSSCFDLGALGWLLMESGKVDMHRYSYIVWANSSVRGPFLPGYLMGRVAWYRLLTELIDADTKLLDPASAALKQVRHPDHGEYGQPHVQTYMGATDRVGLRILLSTSQVVTCHSTLQDTVLYGEMGASKAILDAGYNLASLMIRYVGVDWRDKANWDCNAGQNPLNVDAYDGINIMPLEGMFVKVLASMVETGWPSVKATLKYDEWSAMAAAAAAGTKKNITSNDYLLLLERRLEVIRRKGQECFDVEYYRATSPDEFGKLKPQHLYHHFLEFGFKEGRPYRLDKNCRSQSMQITKIALPAPQAAGREGKSILQQS